MIALEAEALPVPLVLSAVSHSVVEHLPDLLALVSLSLDHSDVSTNSSYHANILLMMRNEHTVWVVSFVHQ